eukprot:4527046-Prymnesium_polylepis.1
MRALSERDLNPQASGFAACKDYVSGPEGGGSTQGRPPRRTVSYTVREPRAYEETRARAGWHIVT